MSSIVDKCMSLPKQSFAEEETVIVQGESVGKFFILLDGEVEILKDEFQIDTVDSVGSVFGEISVLLNLPHMATVKAIKSSTFLVADNPKDFLIENPEVHFHISQLLAKRLNSVTSYLVDLKSQYEDRKDHLGMVDEVLEGLLHQQKTARPNSKASGA